MFNLFKSKKKKDDLDIVTAPLTPVLPFDDAFQERFGFFKGKWLCDEDGIIRVLNFYHQEDGIVKSLDFNVAIDGKPQLVTVAGEELVLYTSNNWKLMEDYYERQNRVRNSLRAFKFKIEKVQGFKTKQERRGSNL